MNPSERPTEARFVLGRYPEVDNRDFVQKRKYRIIWSRMIETIASVATIFAIIYLMIRG